ncbi:hypothetical protein BMS3Bbin01_02078 [bacterium BMS3Bbin01]|nr:hypothetical protein BMS3Bbin01_02078 [bacterium BMS3Bbin01]
MHMYRRHIASHLRNLMTDEQVIILQGPRSVGKSTVLRALAADLDVGIIDMEDPATLAAVKADPHLFVTGEPPILIDEYQHVPELLRAIKSVLTTTSPGRFVLTGSTRHEALSNIEALTGRLHVATVLPLTQLEMEDRDGSVLSIVRDAGSDAALSPRLSPTTRSEYIRRVVIGGFPLAVTRRTPGARARWFNDYVKLCLERDVAELARIDQKTALPVLLNHLMAGTAQLVNMDRISRDADMNRMTATNYTKLLESVFLVNRLPSWGTTLGSRVTKHPKLHAVDSGLAAHLLRLSEEKLASKYPPDLSQFGHLLETFVVGEVLAQTSWWDPGVTLGHWRTRDGAEVDVVIELADGTVMAIEVKTSSNVGFGDWKGLRALRRKLGDRFRAGMVFYLGSRSISLDDTIAAFPLDLLWSPVE